MLIIDASAVYAYNWYSTKDYRSRWQCCLQLKLIIHKEGMKVFDFQRTLWSRDELTRSERRFDLPFSFCFYNGMMKRIMKRADRGKNTRPEKLFEAKSASSVKASLWDAQLVINEWSPIDKTCVRDWHEPSCLSCIKITWLKWDFSYLNGCPLRLPLPQVDKKNQNL